MVNAVHAVHASGGNVAGTAKKLGIPNATLDQWVKGKRVPYLLQLKNDKEGSVIDAASYGVWLLLGGVLDPAAILRAPLSQRATAFGIVFDKLRVLQGLPGQYSASLNANANLAEMLKHAKPEELDRFDSLLTALSGRAESGRGESESGLGPVPELVPSLPEGELPSSPAG